MKGMFLRKTAGTQTCHNVTRQHRPALSVVLVLVCVMSLTLAPILEAARVWHMPQAFAVTNDIESTPDELQKRVEESAQEYDAAVKKLAQIDAQINAAQ